MYAVYAKWTIDVLASVKVSTEFFCEWRIRKDVINSGTPFFLWTVLQAMIVQLHPALATTGPSIRGLRRKCNRSAHNVT